MSCCAAIRSVTQHSCRDSEVDVIWPAVFLMCMSRPLWVIGGIFHAFHRRRLERLINVSEFFH